MSTYTILIYSDSERKVKIGNVTLNYSGESSSKITTIEDLNNSLRGTYPVNIDGYFIINEQEVAIISGIRLYENDTVLLVYNMSINVSNIDRSNSDYIKMDMGQLKCTGYGWKFKTIKLNDETYYYSIEYA